MDARILVIDDNRDLYQLLNEQLKEEGCTVLWARDGIQGLEMVREHKPDLVLLDVMMPRMDGWETCRQIRERSDVPVIFLTALTDEKDMVRGLESGADDYVIKPYRRSELVARVRAALRRAGCFSTDESQIQLDHRLTFVRAQHQVVVDGETRDLSATESRLLAYFVDNLNRTLTHQSLLRQVWGWEYTDQTHYLKVYVHHLRKKIEEDLSRPRYILTERGIGYRFHVP